MIRQHRHWWVGLVFTLAMVFVLSPIAQAAMPPYLWLKIGGQDVAGGVDLAGRVGSCEIFSFEQMTGNIAGGKPQFTLTFQKAIDKASPDLMKAILLQQPVEAKFQFYRVDDTGSETVYYTIEVTGLVTSSTIIVPDVKNAVNERQVHTERVTMAIRTISWTFVPDNEKVTNGNSLRILR